MSNLVCRVLLLLCFCFFFCFNPLATCNSLTKSKLRMICGWELKVWWNQNISSFMVQSNYCYRKSLPLKPNCVNRSIFNTHKWYVGCLGLHSHLTYHLCLNGIAFESHNFRFDDNDIAANTFICRRIRCRQKRQFPTPIPSTSSSTGKNWARCTTL